MPHLFSPSVSNRSNDLPVHRYLLDLDAARQALINVTSTTDSIHFMWKPSRTYIREGHFCTDNMHYVQLQWMTHIMATDLLHYLEKYK